MMRQRWRAFRWVLWARILDLYRQPEVVFWSFAGGNSEITFGDGHFYGSWEVNASGPAVPMTREMPSRYRGGQLAIVDFAFHLRNEAKQDVEQPLGVTLLERFVAFATVLPPFIRPLGEQFIGRRCHDVDRSPTRHALLE